MALIQNMQPLSLYHDAKTNIEKSLSSADRDWAPKQQEQEQETRTFPPHSILGEDVVELDAGMPVIVRVVYQGMRKYSPEKMRTSMTPPVSSRCDDEGSFYLAMIAWVQAGDWEGQADDRPNVGGGGHVRNDDGAGDNAGNADARGEHLSGDNRSRVERADGNAKDACGEDNTNEEDSGDDYFQDDDDDENYSPEQHICETYHLTLPVWEAYVEFLASTQIEMLSTAISDIPESKRRRPSVELNLRFDVAPVLTAFHTCSRHNDEGAWQVPWLEAPSIACRDTMCPCYILDHLNPQQSSTAPSWFRAGEEVWQMLLAYTQINEQLRDVPDPNLRLHALWHSLRAYQAQLAVPDE